MNYKRKHAYEKQPVFLKIFSKYFVIISFLLFVELLLVMIFLNKEYNKVVDRISNDIRANIDKNLEEDQVIGFSTFDDVIDIQDLNSVRAQIYEYTNKLAQKYTEEKSGKSVIFNEFSKINFLGKKRQLYPVEIEIYDMDGEFLCSSERRDSEYYLREEYSSKIKYDSSELKSIAGVPAYYRIKIFYSFRYDCCGGIYFMTFIAVVIDILLSCILSASTYYKRKLIYLTYDYRRKVTNAMAHDLKSPLMIISGNVQNIMLKPHEDVEQHFLENILDTTKYMDRTIHKSLELFELEEKGKKCVNLKEINFNNFFLKVTDKYKDALDKNKLQIQISGDLTAKADEILLEKIYDNIISNIIRYAAEESIVEIEFGKKDIIFKNEVDEKLDIEPEDLVQPFVKGDKSRSGQSGSGLGLSIVREMCELQRFSLNVDIIDNVFRLTIKI